MGDALVVVSNGATRSQEIMTTDQTDEVTGSGKKLTLHQAQKIPSPTLGISRETHSIHKFVGQVVLET